MLRSTEQRAGHPGLHAGILAFVCCVFIAPIGLTQTLEFVPNTLTLVPGETRLVAIEYRRDQGAALTAYQLTMGFDPAVIQVLNPNEAFRGSIPAFAPLGGNQMCVSVRAASPCRDPVWLLTRTGRTAMQGPENIDNVTGVVQIVFGTQGSALPSTDDGAVALVEVSAQQVGNTTLTISSSVIADAADPPAAISHTAAALSIQVAVSNRNFPPVLVLIGQQAVTAGQVLLIDVSASDLNNDPLTFSETSLPVFASLTDNGDGTAQLRIAPTKFNVGTFSLTVAVSDGALVASETIKLRVLRPGSP